MGQVSDGRSRRRAAARGPGDRIHAFADDDPPPTPVAMGDRDEPVTVDALWGTHDQLVGTARLDVLADG